jgi:hypothetical protein
VVVVGSRERIQPAPVAVVWESLTDPRRPTARQWLELLPDEVDPRILETIKPERVMWSSLWPDRPDDLIRFDLRAAGRECSLRWTLIAPNVPPRSSKLGHMRFRLNVLINARLRFSYGQ